MRSWFNTKTLTYALIVSLCTTMVLGYIVWKDRTPSPQALQERVLTYVGTLRAVSSKLQVAATSSEPMSDAERVSLGYWLGWLSAEWLSLRDPNVSGRLFQSQKPGEVSPLSGLDVVQERLLGYIIGDEHIAPYQAKAGAEVFRRLADYIDLELGTCEGREPACRPTADSDVFSATQAAITALHPESALVPQDTLPGFQPVPADFRSGIAADGANPAEVARAFVLGNRDCDCRRVVVQTMATRDDRHAVHVALEGTRDDSIAELEYIVQVDLVNDEWQAGNAWWRAFCHRGFGEEGVCR